MQYLIQGLAIGLLVSLIRVPHSKERHLLIGGAAVILVSIVGMWNIL